MSEDLKAGQFHTVHPVTRTEMMEKVAAAPWCITDGVKYEVKNQILVIEYDLEAQGVRIELITGRHTFAAPDISFIVHDHDDTKRTRDILQVLYQHVSETDVSGKQLLTLNDVTATCLRQLFGIYMENWLTIQ